MEEIERASTRYLDGAMPEEEYRTALIEALARVDAEALYVIASKLTTEMSEG
jgi:hypothetical protein